MPGGVLLYKLHDDPQLGIVQHDLFLAVEFKFNGSDRVVSGAFETGDFTETKLLVFNFLTYLQCRSVAGYKVGAWIVLDGLCKWFGRNIGGLGFFFGWRWSISFFR